MKKSLYFSAAALLSLGVAATACSDEDFGYTKEQISFAKNFRSIYTEVDQTQDWNLAERADVTVSVEGTAQVMIYAKERGEYRLVGDYADVTGTTTLYVDVIEGTTDLLVTDGSHGVFCKVGENVNLSTATRTAITASGDGDQEAQVTVADNYRQFPIEYITTVISNVAGEKGTLPEEEYNLDKVSQNFNFISTGPFTFYPMYWNTTSKHRLGIYWKDAGGHIHTQDIYASKEGDELATCAWSSGTECTDGFPIHIGDKCGGYTTHTISKIEGGKKYYSGLIQCRDAYQWKVGDVCNHSHEITRVDGNNKYYMSDESTCSNYSGGTCYHDGYEYVSDGVHRRKDGVKEEQQCNDNDHTWAVGDVCVAGHQISALNNGSYDGNFYDGFIECTDAMPAHHVGDQCTAGHTIDYIDGSRYYYGSTFTFTSCDLEHRSKQTSSDANDKYIGSKPITVSLPVGTVFGLYLEVYTYGDAYYHTVYSESEVNQRCAKTDLKGNKQGQNSSTLIDGQNYSHTYVFGATFQKEIDGRTCKFFCFEDWNLRGPDLNDLVFMFDSENVPVTMDKDGDHWIISAEDLGNTFDIDYNDVVLDVSHVSGRTTATFLPLAAGGNLASFLYFDNGTTDECLGEIHGLFGIDPKTSGSYTPINVTSTTPEIYSSLQKTVNVATTWSLSTYAVGNIANEMSTAMGGFYMKVVPQGKEATEANAEGQQKIAPTSGATHGADNVPYVLCTPRDWSYNIDANTKKSGKYRWPMENVPMVPTDGFTKGPAYNTTNHSFASWVANKSTAQDWYMYPDLECTTADQLPTNMTISVQTSIGSIIGDFVPTQTPSITADASVTIAVGNTSYPQIQSSSPATITVTSEDPSIATVAYSGSSYFTLTGVKSGTTRVVIHQDAYVNPSDANEKYSDVTYYIAVTVSGPLSVTLPTEESVGRGQMNVVDLITNDPNPSVSVASADNDKVTATYIPSTKQIQITGVTVTDSPVNLTVRVTPSNAELYTLAEGSYIEKTIAVTVTMPQHQLTVSSPANLQMTFDNTKDTQSITASSTTNGTITYTSNKESVVTVSNTGVVTPVGNGDAEITVSASGGSEYETANKIIRVSVTNYPVDYGTKVESFAKGVGAPNDYPAFKIPNANIPSGKTIKVTGVLTDNGYAQIYCATSSYGASIELTVNDQNPIVQGSKSTSDIGNNDYFICIQNGNASDVTVYYTFE